jgi:hypothetical protein
MSVRRADASRARRICSCGWAAVYWLPLVVFAVMVAPVLADDELECHDTTLKPFYQRHARSDAVLATLSLAAYLDCPPDIVRTDAEYRVLEWFPDDERIDFGLAYVVYGKFQKSDPDRRIQKLVAYRGTQFSSPADWFLGNLPLLRFQYRLAEKKLDDVLEDRQSGEEVIYTGHSLGGGLAVSMWRYRAKDDKLISAVSFNGSPMFGCILLHNGTHSCRREQENDDPLWHNAFEKGDPTRIVGNVLFPWRWNWLLKHWWFNRDPYYHRYDFLKPAAITDHDMATLANNLACNTGDTNVDLTNALVAIQCIRDHKGDRAKCQVEIAEARDVLRFDNDCQGRRTGW